MSKKLIVQKEQLSKKLLEEWQNLWFEASSAHFFNSPVWLQICEDYFNEEVSLITVRKEKTLYAVLLMSNHRWFGVNTLSCPSGRFMDKFSILTRNRSSQLTRALLSYLKRQGNFYLTEVDENDTQQFSKITNELRMSVSDINYYLPLEGDPLQHLSKKNSSKIRNRIKNNQDHLSYKTFNGELVALNLAFDIDSRSYKSAKGMATFTHKSNQELFKTILKYLKDDFVIDILYFKSKPVAYTLGFVYKQTYLAINTSFDNDYQQLIPGKILAYLLIKRLQNENFKKLDLGRGESRLKKEFTPFYTLQYNIFYHQKQAALLWWKTTESLYTGLQENVLFYTAYCQLKKLWYR